jgi:hypothetical protein
MILFRTDLILFDELLIQYIFMRFALSRVEDFYKNRRDAILSAADKAAFSQSIVFIMIFRGVTSSMAKKQGILQR